MTQRIASIQPDEATGKTKELFDGVKAKIGMVPNIFKLLAHSSTGLQGVLQFYGALSSGTLDAATRERIALAVANKEIYPKVHQKAPLAQEFGYTA